jgi:hypothetical protein
VRTVVRAPSVVSANRVRRPSARRAVAQANVISRRQRRSSAPTSGTDAAEVNGDGNGRERNARRSSWPWSAAVTACQPALERAMLRATCQMSRLRLRQCRRAMSAAPAVSAPVAETTSD